MFINWCAFVASNKYYIHRVIGIAAKRHLSVPTIPTTGFHTLSTITQLLTYCIASSVVVEKTANLLSNLFAVPFVNHRWCLRNPLFNTWNKQVCVQPRQLGCQHDTAHTCCWAQPAARRSRCQTVGQTDRQTDVRTDARPLHRPCSAYYAGSVKNAIFLSNKIATKNVNIIVFELFIIFVSNVRNNVREIAMSEKTVLLTKH